jgi:hypothetical protein
MQLVPYATLLVLLMGADDFKVRESATYQFTKLPMVRIEDIAFGLESKDLEVRWRLKRALLVGQVRVSSSLGIDSVWELELKYKMPLKSYGVYFVIDQNRDKIGYRDE